MKNRLSYACKKLTKKLSNSIHELNLISKKHVYSNETFELLKKIAQKSYIKGFMSESEFIYILNILGKNVDEFNSKGFIEKSIVWFFADIISDQL